MNQKFGTRIKYDKLESMSELNDRDGQIIHQTASNM